MKNNIFKILVLLLPVALSSCRMDKPEPLPSGKTYAVHLDVTRERTIQEEEEPMAAQKASSTDLYGIQVYKKGLSTYSKYAYGIYDNVEDIYLELAAGSTYKIEMTLIPNGKTTIATGSNGGYQEPFLVGGFSGEPGTVTNQMVQSINNYLDGLSSGYAVVQTSDGGSAGYNRPPISRFYGVVEFTPTADSRLTIDLKWVCFGLTIAPEGLTDGHIEVEMEGAPTLTVTPDTPDAVTKQIFTFDHSLSTADWSADDYSESVPITVTWVKSDGTRVVFRDQSTPTTLKRKINTIFPLSLTEEASNSNVTINREEEILTDQVEVIVRP